MKGVGLRSVAWMRLRVRIPPGAWISVVSVVLSGGGLRQADHSSRGVTPSVVYLSVIMKPGQ